VLLDIRNLQVIVAANGDEVETVFEQYAFIRVTRAVHEVVSNPHQHLACGPSSQRGILTVG
jgi:hypothetical protein